MPHRVASPRQLVLYAAVIALVLCARPQLPTFVAGAGLGLLGIVLRVWGCGHLRKNQDLVTSGPYAHVKHPLYLGTLLVATGAIVAAGSPRMPGLLVWVVGGPLFALAFFAYYLPKKKRIEGGRLQSRFGDRYPAWGDAVPDFVPSWRPWPGAARQRWSWRIFLANHELPMDALIAALFAALWLPGALWGSR